MSENMYDDLFNTDLGENIIKLERNNKALERQIEKLEGDVARLCTELTNMKQVQANLTRNISELFKTAKIEIARKDRIIAELRSELDDLLFRRQDRARLAVENISKRQRNDSPIHELDQEQKRPKLPSSNDSDVSKSERDDYNGRHNSGDRPARQRSRSRNRYTKYPFKRGSGRSSNDRYAKFDRYRIEDRSKSRSMHDKLTEQPIDGTRRDIARNERNDFRSNSEREAIRNSSMGFTNEFNRREPERHSTDYRSNSLEILNHDAGELKRDEKSDFGPRAVEKLLEATTRNVTRNEMEGYRSNPPERKSIRNSPMEFINNDFPRREPEHYSKDFRSSNLEIADSYADVLKRKENYDAIENGSLEKSDFVPRPADKLDKVRSTIEKSVVSRNEKDDFRNNSEREPIHNSSAVYMNEFHRRETERYTANFRSSRLEMFCRKDEHKVEENCAREAKGNDNSDVIESKSLVKGDSVPRGVDIEANVVQEHLKSDLDVSVTEAPQSSQSANDDVTVSSDNSMINSSTARKPARRRRCVMRVAD